MSDPDDIEMDWLIAQYANDPGDRATALARIANVVPNDARWLELLRKELVAAKTEHHALCILSRLRLFPDYWRVIPEVTNHLSHTGLHARGWALALLEYTIIDYPLHVDYDTWLPLLEAKLQDDFLEIRDDAERIIAMLRKSPKL